ncbi:MAG: prepilin-type N-terminal cleavage/methylation domain-containing protein [Planctomycetota bacterium]|jgi:prepilin-type N-terminal cleavage/methylation domain-containing protein
MEIRRLRLHAANSGTAGFSLIELLAVMVILSILMTFLAFQLGALGDSAKTSATETFIAQIGGAVSSFEQETGDYPPSSWQSDWGPVPNKTNLGGETMCVALWGKEYHGCGISEDKLINSDDDEGKTSLTTHANNDLFELVDSWGNPIAYVHRRDYAETHDYMTIDEESVWDISVVKALKNSTTGNFHNPRGFQLISAGSNGIFGDEDDIYNFTVKQTE